MNALSQRDAAAFQRQLLLYLGGFGVGIPVLVLADYYQVWGWLAGWLVGWLAGWLAAAAAGSAVAARWGPVCQTSTATLGLPRAHPDPARAPARLPPCQPPCPPLHHLAPPSTPPSVAPRARVAAVADGAAAGVLPGGPRLLPAAGRPAGGQPGWGLGWRGWDGPGPLQAAWPWRRSGQLMGRWRVESREFTTAPSAPLSAPPRRPAHRGGRQVSAACQPRRRGRRLLTRRGPPRRRAAPLSSAVAPQNTSRPTPTRTPPQKRVHGHGAVAVADPPRVRPRPAVLLRHFALHLPAALRRARGVRARRHRGVHRARQGAGGARGGGGLGCHLGLGSSARPTGPNASAADRRSPSHPLCRTW
jgi:hypothetical protein